MLNTIKNNAVVKWTYTQFSIKALIHSFIVMGIFGFIPGAWLVGLPLLGVYGLIKQKSIIKALTQFGLGTADFWNKLNHDLALRIADLINHQTVSIFKGIAAFTLLLTMGLSSWSLIAIYGIYRYSNEEWTNTFQNWLNRFIDFFKTFSTEISQGPSFRKKVMLLSVFAALLAWELYIGGPIAAVVMAASCLQLAIVATGFSAVLRDIGYILRNPIKSVLDNSGKICGVLWGRWVAFQIFPGRIVGSLGHAVGYVESQGVFSGFLSSFLTPMGWFSSYNGLSGMLASKVRSFLNGIVTGLFVTTEMQTQGDFYGVIGPTSLQIFALMVAGGLIGYGIERFVDSLCSSVAKDSVHVASKIKNAKQPRDFIYQTRWHMGYIALATPAILCSQGGPALITFAGGSLAEAALLTAGGIALSFATIYGTFYGLHYAWDWVLNYKRAPQQEKPDTAKPKRNMP